MTVKARTLEKALQKTIVDLAETLGWTTVHCYPLRTAHGWRTSLTTTGYPDLTCFRGGYVVAIEVKGSTGVVRPGQGPWLRRFAALGCGRAWLVTPKTDFNALGRWFRDPENAPRIHGFDA